jgi:hypothetical protein
MSGAPPEGPCTAHIALQDSLWGADAPSGAPALTFSTVTNRPTTTTEYRQVVGETLC